MEWDENTLGVYISGNQFAAVFDYIAIHHEFGHSEGLDHLDLSGNVLHTHVLQGGWRTTESQAVLMR